jgi:hypothetical protein
MSLVVQLFVQLVMCSTVWVHHHWNLLIVVGVLLALCLKSWGLVHCLRGDFLHQIHVCWVMRLQGRASW